MRTRRLAALLLALACIWAVGAQATQAEHVTATHAWIRLLPGDLPAGGYVTLQNNNASSATLTGAHSSEYASVMLHQSLQDASGISRMVMTDSLSIPAKGNIALAPAGYHLMLEQASTPPKVGDKVQVTFDFSDGSHLPVDFVVRPANAIDGN